MMMEKIVVGVLLAALAVNEEITKTIRDMAGKGDVMETLRRLQQAQHEVYAGSDSGREEMSYDA